MLKKFILGTAAALLASASAHAQLFIEAEPNDSFATAQVLSNSGDFSVTGFREAIAENTFTDFFSFSATSGNELTLALNVIGDGDPVLRLFDNLGNVLAEDDDSGDGFNSLIVFNAAYTGNYVVGFRGFSNSTYNYEFSATGLTAAVPEPATWAMMLIGFGAVGYSMRRRRKSEATAQLA